MLGFQWVYVGHGCIFSHVFRKTLYAVIVVFGVNIGTGRSFARGLRVRCPYFSCHFIKQLPCVVVVKFGQICNERAIYIMGFGVVEPNTALFSAVADRCRAPRPRLIGFRLCLDRYRKTLGIGAARQCAVDVQSTIFGPEITLAFSKKCSIPCSCPSAVPAITGVRIRDEKNGDG